MNQIWALEYIPKRLDFRRWRHILHTQSDSFVLLQERLGGDVTRDVKLAPLTTFKVGGPAKFFFQANNPRDLIYACDLAHRQVIRYFVLGGGSNVLFADAGFDGFVIRDHCAECKISGEKITAQGGVWLDDLVDLASENSLTGFEFAAGIPGNVGGAIYGNAGAFGGCIADILEQAVVYSPARGVRIVDNRGFRFGYRHSKLKESFELVLTATFRLQAGEKPEIVDKADKYRQLRRDKHPDYTRDGCAGSIFKNIKEPEIIPAGRLLDEAGVRGMTIGGAEVYEKHCNIIINNGTATASDIIELSRRMRRKVIEKFGIELEYEMIIVNQ